MLRPPLLLPLAVTRASVLYSSQRWLSRRTSLPYVFPLCMTTHLHTHLQATATTPAAAATTTTTATTPAATTAAKKDPAPAAAKDEPKKEPAGEKKDNAAYPGLPAGVTPLGVAKALFDYGASEEGELTFKANDLITILQKDPSGTGLSTRQFTS